MWPSRPALNNGRVQQRVRGAYLETGKPALSTSELIGFTHLRKSLAWDDDARANARRSILRVCSRYCERVGRVGPRHAILWRYLG
jgi:hypothetical protein